MSAATNHYETWIQGFTAQSGDASAARRPRDLVSTDDKARVRFLLRNLTGLPL